MEQPAAATSLQVIVGDMPAAHCPGWSKAVVLNRMIYSNTIFLWACKPRRRHCRRLRRRETGKIGKTQKRIEPSRAASSGAESSVLTARIMQAGELWPREHWILPADVWRKSRAELHEAMFAAGLHGIFFPHWNSIVPQHVPHVQLELGRDFSWYRETESTYMYFFKKTVYILELLQK